MVWRKAIGGGIGWDGQIELAVALNKHAISIHAQGRLTEVEPLCRAVLVVLQEKLGTNHSTTQTIQQTLDLFLAQIATSK